LLVFRFHLDGEHHARKGVRSARAGRLFGVGRVERQEEFFNSRKLARRKHHIRHGVRSRFHKGSRGGAAGKQSNPLGHRCKQQFVGVRKEIVQRRSSRWRTVDLQISIFSAGAGRGQAAASTSLTSRFPKTAIWKYVVDPKSYSPFHTCPPVQDAGAGLDRGRSVWR